MQPDLLQQLRDIHLPPEPLWWPPAPGWWLLALLAIAGLGYAIHLLRAAMRRRRPIKQARALYQQLHGNFQKGVIDAPTYLHESNELLKRLFIHGLHEDAARPANDESWLALLDAQTGSQDFTQGPGRQLGNQRFQPDPVVEPELLHPLLERLFREARP